MEIRQAKKKDAALLSTMCAEVQQLHADNEPGTFKPPSDPFFAEGFFQRMLANPDIRIFIAGESGVLMGYIIAQIVRREENPFSYARNFLHIDQIGVLAEQRGKGCGRALMQRARQLAEEEELSNITLNSWHFNTGAHAFFRSLGFETYTIQMWMNLADER